jgi:membrane-associated phospholipid phosphatase
MTLYLREHGRSTDNARDDRTIGPLRCSCLAIGAMMLVVAVAIAPAQGGSSNSSDPEDGFVGSTQELIIGGAALVGSAVFEFYPPNDDHPLIGGSQKPYIHRERVPDWSVGVAHLTSLAVIGWGSAAPAAYRRAHVHGYLMAAAINAFGVAFTKGIIGRLRPNYEDAKLRGIEVKSKSFYSGHASNAFLIATYGTLYSWSASERVSIRVGVPIALYAGAVYTAWSRVKEHRHYTSDVVVGSVAGTAIAVAVYRWYDGMAGPTDTEAVALTPLPQGLLLSINLP